MNWKREIENLEGWSYGDDPKVADHLARETAAGRNLGNCFAWFSHIKMPTVGEVSYIKDSKENPVCVVEVVKVTKIPFNQVDVDFAKAEGYSGLNEWRIEHLAFFGRQHPGFTEDSLVICQRFKVLHVFDS